VDVSLATLCLDSPDCLHKARSVGGVAPWVYVSAEMCRGLTKKPCLFSSSGLSFSIVDRVLAWNPRQPLDPARKRLITVFGSGRRLRSGKGGRQHGNHAKSRVDCQVLRSLRTRAR